MSNRFLQRPELLAPAGDWECVRAAIENGADAVYFGLECGFNARARAANFALEDLPRLIETLHRRGLKGYATLNTLVFHGELVEFERVVRAVARAGVDAVLVQDIGAARLIRAVCPDLPIHASTQMTMTSAENIALAEALGVERVVVARELSIEEIRKIREQTSMPLETFVHGALCVAYSGQCLTSESLGGRSANRGQCAQACRLPYELIADGKRIDLGEQKYLLSPQDLAAFTLAPELIEAGVCSFKIEGRLKTPEYVANMSRHYRRAIDTAWEGRTVEFSPREIEEMELSFSRGFSPGWLQGNDHKMLVPAKTSDKRGVHIGEILGVRGERVTVRLTKSLKRGDGVMFDSGYAGDDQPGGRVYEIFSQGRSIAATEGGLVDLAFAHGKLDFSRLKAGRGIWKTDDPELVSRLRKSFTSVDPLRQLPIDLTLRVETGRPIEITAQCADGLEITWSPPEIPAEAQRHPLTEETLREQFSRLGGTPFSLRNLRAEITGSPMLPFSVLGKLRKELVERLEGARTAVPERTIAEESVLHELRAEIGSARVSAERDACLRVLVRSLEQLRCVLSHDVREIYADFHDIREYREAVSETHAAGAMIYLAPPRIQKPGEMGVFHALAKHRSDGFLVRNYAGLRFCTERGITAIADFSLNVTNELSAQFFRTHGALRITPSYDLNRDQLLELTSAVPSEWLETVIHQHMPMFHMEHCVFCAVYSPGTNPTNCGRPCDRHVLKLSDRIGHEHPLEADVCCRNTLFNAVPQSAAEVVPALLTQGLRDFRVELLRERPDEIGAILSLYRSLLAGTISGKEVWTRLKAANRVGVTRGTLEERRNPLAIL